MTRASVVVPAYRRPRQLAACLDALVAQDLDRDAYEVVVVDDGSPQPLAPVVERFTGRGPVRLVRRSNAGPATARNTGAREARGDLVAFTDDDCRPDAEWLGALLAAHGGRDEVMLGGRVVNALPEDPYATASQLLVDHLYDYYAEHPEGRFFTSNNLAVARDAFLEMGGFDTSFAQPAGEDRELCDRWRHRGGELEHVTDAVVHHAHEMDLQGFLRQHYRYGKGAYHYHERRAAREGGEHRIEPLDFYRRMLRADGIEPLGRRLTVRALLIASQGVNALGYARERLRA